MDLNFASMKELERSTSSSKGDSNILSSDILQLTQYIDDLVNVQGGPSCPIFVDVIMDNVGVECCADLLFAVWLTSASPHTVAVLHVKPLPFYVSDTNPVDIDHLLETLRRALPSSAEFVNLVEFHLKKSHRIQVKSSSSWVTPCEFRELPPSLVNEYFYAQRLCPNGARTFSKKSSLVIVKGDLNFRRLVGDRHWDRRMFMSTVTLDCQPALEPLHRHARHARECPSLRAAIEDYWPCDTVPVAALRVLKSEIVANVPVSRMDEIDAVDPEWRWNGKWGIIAFTGAPRGVLT
jgi:hypothetical protein